MDFIIKGFLLIKHENRGSNGFYIYIETAMFSRCVHERRNEISSWLTYSSANQFPYNLKIISYLLVLLRHYFNMCLVLCSSAFGIGRFWTSYVVKLRIEHPYSKFMFHLKGNRLWIRRDKLSEGRIYMCVLFF